MSSRAFPVAAGRFDQKDEMFKRSVWDESLRPLSDRFREIAHRERPGYRKLDYALRNASWNIEWGAACGNSAGDHGLYSWNHLNEKTRANAEVGDPVQGPPAELAGVVKRAAQFLGAAEAGIAAVHPHWVYSHEFNLLTGEHTPIDLPAGCDKAVVLVIEMDYQAVRSAPTGIGGAATGLGYSQMAVVASLVAAFIRGLGYRALPAGNDTALSIPLAMAAGLGEWSRMGLLVTPRYGPRVRLCKVFTDMPLATDEYRPFGVVDFCRVCAKCAEHCPSRAIPDGEMTDHGPNRSNQSGVRKWYVDAERCYGFWAKQRMDCCTCIRVCPFNKQPGRLHDVARAAIRAIPWGNPLLVRADDLLGYGRPRPAQEFWDEPQA